MAAVYAKYPDDGNKVVLWTVYSTDERGRETGGAQASVLAPILDSTNLLLELNRPAEATVYFQKALRRTPNRPKLISGLARAAQLQDDTQTAKKRYEEFLAIWITADSDRPELATAREFLRDHRP
jgi:hypothetical protein